jgi:hypothetical protein
MSEPAKKPPTSAQIDRLAVIGMALACAVEPIGALTGGEVAKVCRSAAAALIEVAAELDAAAAAAGTGT